MKFVMMTALLVLAQGAAIAQPITTACSEAIHTYVSFSSVFLDFTRKNAEILSQASADESVSSWFEAPMAKLQAETHQNFLKLKQPRARKNKCTLNYTTYLNLITKLESFSRRLDVTAMLLGSVTGKEKRIPASFTAALLSSQEKSPTELRSVKRKVGIVAQALSQMQMANCLEKMIQNGELKALNADQAAALYTRYLNNYVQNGGKIASVVDIPLHESSSSAALKSEIAQARQNGESDYADNLEQALAQSTVTKIYVARKSFRACPMSGSNSIKIMVPRGVTITGTLGQNELIPEVASQWNPAQAIQYSDTRVEQYPGLVLKNKVGSAKNYFLQWMKEAKAPTIAAE